MSASVVRWECGVCWHVYDPAEGDPVWQIAPGTAFADLPPHWRCPRCDTEKARFIALEGDSTLSHPPPGTGRAEGDPSAALVRAYEAASVSMRDLPVYNRALTVEAIGFHRREDAWLGIVVTPWFMNLVLVPAMARAWDGWGAGSRREWRFPSGRYDFITTHLDGLGAVQTCSLFSPMADFATQAAAREMAVAALDAFLAPDPALSEPPRPVDRRAFLRGGRG